MKNFIPRMTRALPTAIISLAINSISGLYANEAVALFNGKDLTDWKGEPKLWSVRDGMIVGSSVGHPVKSNTFLIWQGGEVENFMIEAKVRVEGANNSGLQYRSELLEPEGFALSGYQCDMHPKKEYLGMLYGEKTTYGIMAKRGEQVHFSDDGKKLITGAVGDDTGFTITEWNDYTVIAAGKRVIHQVNGVTIIDVTDESPVNRRKGLIGLQLHAGKPMTVYAKAIELKNLSLEEATKALTTAVGKIGPAPTTPSNKKATKTKE